jgi:DNA-binding response OmpR family regulator
MNILLIEDDAVFADGLIHTLINSGYSVTGATMSALCRAFAAIARLQLDRAGFGIAGYGRVGVVAQTSQP